jgi:branched-chain amino acid transport system permease protein
MHSLFMSYLVLGIIYGCLYALTATGLVVTYTTSGIFNFGHGAIGMFMTFTYWQLTVQWHVPVVIALVVVLFVMAPLFGALIERFFIRSLYGASLGVTLVVTLGILLFLLGLADWAWNPTVTRHLPSLVPGQVSLFGVVVTYYQFMVLGIAVAVAVLLRVLFTRSRVGMTMRAVVDDRDLTARAGASPQRTAQLSWALGASLAALAGILIAPLQYLDQLNLTLLVVFGYAAAVAGRLRSLPLTVAGGLFLGLVWSYAVGYLPNNLLSNLNPVIPMAVLFAALLLLRQERLQTARLALRRSRQAVALVPSLGIAVLFVAGTFVMAQILSAGNLLTFGSGLCIGIVVLSLVLLAGYGGQVSLAQMTFAGLGAYFMGKVAGGNSIVGLVAAFALPALIGGVLALVVLRLRGLYLALATFAFAYGMDNLFFNKLLGFGGILNVGRFLVHSQKAFLMEVSILFAALAVGVMAIKRGPFGRRLAAINDSEAASASIGMNITATKVTAFVLAAGIAGLGGAMYGGWQGEVGPTDFQWLTSLIVLLLVALGGIDSVPGAFLVSVFYASGPVIQRHLQSIPNFQLLLVGLGAITLGRNPGGIATQLSDAVENIRALRGSLRARQQRRAAPAGISPARDDGFASGREEGGLVVTS